MFSWFGKPTVASHFSRQVAPSSLLAMLATFSSLFVYIEASEDLLFSRSALIVAPFAV